MVCQISDVASFAKQSAYSVTWFSKTHELYSRSTFLGFVSGSGNPVHLFFLCLDHTGCKLKKKTLHVQSSACMFLQSDHRFVGFVIMNEFMLTLLFAEQKHVQTSVALLPTQIHADSAKK